MATILDLFSFIRQIDMNPPVPFPETIVKGYGFSKPTLVQHSTQGIEFVEINASDAKCIGIYWNTDQGPCFVIKTPLAVRACSNIKLLDITKGDIVFQRFIPGKGKYRLYWRKSNTIKIVNENKQVVSSIKQKNDKNYSAFEKLMKEQCSFIVKALNKALHFSYGAEVSSLELDFIKGSEFYSLGIHSLRSLPKKAMHRIDIFPSLIEKRVNSDTSILPRTTSMTRLRKSREKKNTNSVTT